nr:MAG TPA: DNA adenine methylase [Caudoviricetes sp.]
MDYQAVPIPENSVIYCDIPYKGTSGYNLKEKFDHERFYDWCAKQTQPVFISSYDMPEDKFTCIACFEHSGIFAVGINSKVEERIFIPKHQTYKPPFRNLEIF